LLRPVFVTTSRAKRSCFFPIHEYHLRKSLLPILDAAEKITNPKKRLALFIKEHTVKVVTRRKFIKMAGVTGAALAGASWLPRMSRAAERDNI
jgi:hypothetical protein